MSIHDLKKGDEDSGGSKTYIEFNSDGSEAQRKAYRLASRGGRLREGIEDIDELYARLTPLLAEFLFEDDPSRLLEWLELDEEAWEHYQENVLENDD